MSVISGVRLAFSSRSSLASASAWGEPCGGGGGTATAEGVGMTQVFHLPALGSALRAAFPAPPPAPVVPVAWPSPELPPQPAAARTTARPTAIHVAHGARTWCANDAA